MKSLHPILSWLLASTLFLGDIVPREAKALSPRIRIYLGKPVGEFEVGKAVLGEPFAEIICCVGQEARPIFVWT